MRPSVIASKNSRQRVRERERELLRRTEVLFMASHLE